MRSGWLFGFVVASIVSSPGLAAPQDINTICAAQVGWAYPKFDACVARLSATPLGSTLAQGESQGNPNYLKLDSHHPGWTSTGLSVGKGDTLRFRATGTFVWDPSTKEPVVGPDGASWTPAEVSNPGDFQLFSARIASLIGRVGNWVFPIGASRSVQAQATGELLLGINERWASGAWDNNQGILHVLVQVATQPPGETTANTAGGAAQHSSSFTFEVDSTRGWQPTSLAVTAGQQVTLSAVGKWNVDARNFSFVGPQGYTPQEDERIYQGCKVDPSQPYGVLLVRFGNEPGFHVVGAAGTLTAHYSGPVSFRINDADSCLGDNSGSVKITAYPGSATAAQPEEGQAAATSSPAASGREPGRYSRIEQVDFLNFTYPTDQTDCSNPPPNGRRTVTLKGGKFSKRYNGSGFLGILDYGIATNVVYGDISGSHIGAAVIALACNYGANFSVTTVYVYTLQSGMPVLLAKITADSVVSDYYRYYPRNDNGPVWGITSLMTGGGKIVIYEEVDAPHACPKNIARFIYIWNGSSFRLAGRPEKHKNPQCP